MVLGISDWEVQGFRVLGFRILGLGIRVQCAESPHGLGWRVWDSGFMASGSGFGSSGSWFGHSGVGSRGQDLCLERLEGSGVRVCG
mmetsp:Transcript_27133/g.42443  ORF Transcript_27133/g.42443 Transcript_27133/m.42443 type:complete len:86 (+) Transcript_27133:90-347(+)